jgi:dihydroorotate dehydrogenase electron transfer subunit
MVKSEPQPSRGVFAARVRSNRRLCDEHYLLRLEVGTDFPLTQAGQFVQVQCAPVNGAEGPIVHEWGEKGPPPQFQSPELVESQVLLRRPFSLAGREEIGGRTVLDIIHRVVGRGSARLAALAEGQTVSLLGPLGNAFTWDADTKLAVLVGGGVGLPPMLYLAERLHQAGKPALAYAGVTSANLLPLSLDAAVPASKAGWPSLCVREFARWGVQTTISTDDGSLGYTGRISQALFDWIDQGRIVAAGTIVYTCGPERMMRAVAEGCLARGFACQVAMERKMACGMGACQSCVCKTRAQNPLGWQYSLVCTDGTVFDARQILWE